MGGRKLTLRTCGAYPAVAYKASCSSKPLKATPRKTDLAADGIEVPHLQTIDLIHGDCFSLIPDSKYK